MAESHPAITAAAGRPYLHFDGMCWPNPDDPREVAWRLTHGTPTREDLLTAVSFIGAYQQLVADPQRVRNGKVTRIRAARDAGRGVSGGVERG